MKTMTEPATDRHLDELSKRVDFGFDQTSQRLGRVEDDVRALRVEMKAGFDQVHDDFAGLRGEFGDEFTAVRGEMKAGFDQVHDDFGSVHEDFGRINGEISGFRGEVNGEFTVVRREASSESIKLRAEMKAGFDGLQRQMTRFFAGTLGTVIAGVIVNVILSHS